MLFSIAMDLFSKKYSRWAESFFVFYLLCLGGLGCSLSPNTESPRIKFSFESQNKSSFYVKSFSLQPSHASDFSCFMVNVMGSGIPPLKPEIDTQSLLNQIANNQFCSYAGITSAPILNTGANVSVELSVPSGPGRVIQVIGVNDGQQKYCNSNIKINGLSGDFKDSEGIFYDLGHVKLDLFSSQSVSIPNSYDALTSADQAKHDVSCFSGAAPSPNPPPIVTGVFPSEGLTTGGQTITITGSAFQPSALVSMGGAACSGVVVDSATQIRCTTPAIANSGSATVMVSHSDGNSGSFINGYTYILSSNLFFWYKADSIVGVPDGGPVSVWKDGSGNGNDVSQVAAAEQPLYVKTSSVFKPALKFNGVAASGNSLSKTVPAPQPSPSDFAVFFVAKETGNHGGTTAAFSFGSNGKNTVFLGGGSFTDFNFGSTSGLLAFPALWPTDIYFYWSVLVADATSSTGVTVFRNGISLGNGAPNGAVGMGGALSKILIGQALNSVSPPYDPDPGSYFLGEIAEIIGYKANVSAERLKIEAYFKAKYGL